MEIIKAEDYGLEITKADELTSGLEIVKSERDLLIEEFNEVAKLEVTQDNLPKFRNLRLKIVENRTQGINKWHKATKNFFLTGGRFVDAIKNKEILVNEQMESKLMDAEKHFENLEKKRLADLQNVRVALLSEFLEDASERDLSSMDQDVWEYCLATKKQAYLDVIAAELQAEKERVAKELAEKAEQERIRKDNELLKAELLKREEQAKIEADKLKKIEADRIAKENAERLQREAAAAKERAEYEAKLKAEREAKERIEREERLKREKLEAQIQAQKDAELQAQKDAEAKLQSELSKGDEAKIQDLIKDLELLKSKYLFKSAKSKKMYSDVCGLIDKVTSFINK
jgi:colicin import membrane protein